MLSYPGLFMICDRRKYHHRFECLLNQRSDRFYNITLVRSFVRLSRIDLGNRSKDFSKLGMKFGDNKGKKIAETDFHTNSLLSCQKMAIFGQNHSFWDIAKNGSNKFCKIALKVGPKIVLYDRIVILPEKIRFWCQIMPKNYAKNGHFGAKIAVFGTLRKKAPTNILKLN